MKKPRQKGIKDGIDDEGLWKAVTRTIKPYTDGKRKPSTPEKAASGKTVPGKTVPEKIIPDKAIPGGGASHKSVSAAPKKPVVLSVSPGIKPLPAAAPAAPAFDRGIEEKLKKGKLPAEARLDLHGMTQEEAHRALQRFIPSAAKAGTRTLLIITGKGKTADGKTGGGVLKRMVPLWLQETSLRGYIIALSTAPVKDGGSGALYVRLKKKK
jgi:DNA-nicking Smr family endonuclease